MAWMAAAFVMGINAIRTYLESDVGDDNRDDWVYR